MLKGKGAVVTGSTSGIGLGIAQSLAAQGANIVLNGFGDAAEIDKIRTDIERTHGVRAFYDGSDLSTAEGSAGLVRAAEKALGAVDILVNNAGIQHVAPIEDFPDDRWDLVIAINLSSSLLMARAVVPAMLASGWGRIVNISMNYETMRRAGFSPYGPSKAALESETIIWAQDLDGTGVTVNGLLPGGATATGMIPDSLPQQVRSGLLDPAIVVPPLLWLAFLASDGVTGRRRDASRWRRDLSEAEAAKAAFDDAGWAAG
jgi:3-oxoacyl-[acyl-carrier protein] reductase